MSENQEADVRSTRRRQWRLLVVLLVAATGLGACSSGSSSGEAEAPRRTDPEPSPTTTVVATTVPTAPTTVAGRSSSTTRRPTAPTTVPRRPAAYPGIYPETSWEDLDRAEAAFAQGHQPWRASYVDVAQRYLEDQLKVDPGSLAPTGPQGSIVTYRAGAVAGSVHLAKPAGAVAVVVASDTSRIDDAIRLHRSGDEVHVELTARAAGTVHAMAGAFQSEWTVDEAKDVTPGATVRFTLDTGLGDVPLLIRFRHEGADGAVGTAERRVN